MSAVMTENIEIGEILLEAGADPLLVMKMVCQQLTMQGR
jgi:hypothetical protein